MACFIASHVDLNLRIEIERSTFDQASVIISTNLQAARAIRRWKISVKKIAKTTGSVLYGQAQQYDTPATGSRERFDFPLQFEAGSSYRVTVAPMEWSGGIYQNLDNSVEQTADFRAGIQDTHQRHRVLRYAIKGLDYGTTGSGNQIINERPPTLKGESLDTLNTSSDAETRN